MNHWVKPYQGGSSYVSNIYIIDREIDQNLIFDKMGSFVLFQLSLLCLIFSVISADPVQGRISSRIIGGDVAEVGEFPWQVSLRYYGSHFCGGTLITIRHVLSAAHCMQGMPLDPITVISGTNSLATGGETHAVKEFEWHESYVGSQNSYLYDVSVITLAAAITTTALQLPISLPTENIDSGIEVIASGWGRVLIPSVVLPTALQKTSFTTVNSTQCQESWSEIRNYVIDSSHLCALENYGVGVCNGDSGSGLIYNNQIVGIVSFGNPCALGYPDVYTRVFSYLSWIRERITVTEDTAQVLEDTMDIKYD